MSRITRLTICGATTAAVVLTSLFLPPYLMRIPTAQRDANHIVDAIVQYHKQFTNFPPQATTSNAHLVAALDRGNPWGMPFIRIPPYRKSPDGSFVDPWNHPYHFVVTDQTNVTVWSNGPDMLDQQGDGDDITARKGIQP